MRKIKMVDFTNTKTTSFTSFGKQPRPHHPCAWPECDQQIKHNYVTCVRHWFWLPEMLRSKLKRVAQDLDEESTLEYITVSNEIEEWIRQNPK